ncbi:MAG: DUF308 domain-containing protein [Mycetocola sp.]
MSFSFSVEPGQFTKAQLNGIRVALAVAGLAAVVVGIAILVWTNASLVLVAWLFGIFFVITGVARIARGVGSKTAGTGIRILSVVLGVLILAAGIYIFFNPVFGVEVLGFTIGFTWILEGIASLVDRPASSRWFDVVYAIVSIIGGILIFFIPVAAVAILLKIAAIVLLIGGVVQIAQAITLGRKVKAQAAG